MKCINCFLLAATIFFSVIGFAGSDVQHRTEVHKIARMSDGKSEEKLCNTWSGTYYLSYGYYYCSLSKYVAYLTVEQSNELCGELGTINGYSIFANCVRTTNSGYQY